MFLFLLLSFSFSFLSLYSHPFFRDCSLSARLCVLRQWQQTDLKPSSLPGVIAMSFSLIVVAVAMPVTSRCCPTLRSVKFISSCRHIITHRLSMIDVIRDFSRSVTLSRRYRVFFLLNATEIPDRERFDRFLFKSFSAASRRR